MKKIIYGDSNFKKIKINSDYSPCSHAERGNKKTREKHSFLNINTLSIGIREFILIFGRLKPTLQSQ